MIGLSEIENRYDVNNVEVVFDFIAKHTGLEALLIPARDQLERQ